MRLVGFYCGVLLSVSLSVSYCVNIVCVSGIRATSATSDEDFSPRSNNTKKRRMTRDEITSVDIKKMKKIWNLANKVKKVQTAAACLAGYQVSRGAQMKERDRDAKTDELYQIVSRLVGQRFSALLVPVAIDLLQLL